MDLNKLQNYYFPGREPDEQIIMALKRHKIVIGKRIFWFIIGLLLPIGLYLVADYFTDWLTDTADLLYIIVIFVFSIFYLYLLLFIYHAWVDYYLDVWLVTNQRIIAMEQRGLFNRVVSELRLNRIQDVSSEVSGFLATIFKYGRIRIQTASELDRFEFYDVPDPELAARQILELHEQYLSANPAFRENGQTPPPAAATNTRPPYGTRQI